MPAHDTSPGSPIDRTKLSKYDTAALALIRANPSLTPSAVSSLLVNNGLAKSKSTIFERFKHNDYFKAEFQAVRKNIEEQMARELAPLAIKAQRKALKDKTLHARDKFPYVKLALDKVTADRRDAGNDSPISIGSVQQLQVVFQGTLLDDNAGQNSK
jgi:hypothetical protein